MTEQKNPTKKKRKKKGRQYFTQVHEDAIIEFVKSNDRARRNYLYLNVISPAFEEMIDKIVFTYKFINLPNIELLKDECAVYLSTILPKYDPGRKSKAFSYFSVVVKNWFSSEAKKNKKMLDREVELEQVSRKAEMDHLSFENPYHEERNKQEFMDALWSEMDDWEAEELKENEEKVLKAVKKLLEDPDFPPMHSKKAVYLYLREMTGLNTKQVLQGLNRFRKNYGEFKKEWDEE